MRTTRRWRIAIASTSMLMVVGGATALGLLSLSALPGADTSDVQDSVAEGPELGICMEANPFDWVAAAPDPACDACPKRIPGEPCTRISCDPCCYRCSGESVPRCY